MLTWFEDPGASELDCHAESLAWEDFNLGLRTIVANVTVQEREEAEKALEYLSIQSSEGETMGRR